MECDYGTQKCSPPSLLTILYLQIHLLSKTFLQPPNQYLQRFHSHLLACAQQKKIRVAQFPPEVGRGGALLPCCSPPTVNKRPSRGLLRATWFTFFVLFDSDFAISVALKCSTEVLSGVPKHEKAVMYLTKNTCERSLVFQCLLAESSVLMNQHFLYYIRWL